MIGIKPSVELHRRPKRVKALTVTAVTVTTVDVFLLLVTCCWSQPITDVEYVIEEEVEIGTYVGNVLPNTMLVAEDTYRQEDHANLQFRFIRQHHVMLFVLDSSTGIVRTGSRIDRDTLCPGAETCGLRLDIAVQPAQYFRIIRATVNITDINDNSPRFPDRELVFDVLETAVVGTGLVIPSAVDPDSKRFSVHSYRIMSDHDVFDVKEMRKPDDSSELRLILNRPLDRETTDRFYIQVEAMDGGVPARSGSVDIYINVVDVNDNSPIFERDVYVTTILENIPLMSRVATVRATDRDTGLNGQVVYEFSTLTVSSYTAGGGGGGRGGLPFGISNETGEIYVTGPIDYEDRSVYRLVVVARDLGPDSTPGSVTVTINVLDSNDNPPEIIVDTLSSVPGIADAAEMADVGTFVAHVSISDRDSGLNGQFNCTLNDGRFSLTKLYGTEYKVTTGAILDREEQDHYSIAIICTDFGDDPQVSVEHLSVRVTDVNDHYPTFTQRSYTGDLIENNYVGVIVLYVNATDEDIGENGDITYSIEGSAADSFEVEASTGAVKAVVSFDAEVGERVHFTIVARDRGRPPKSGQASVIVNIVDVNDERPQFSQVTYSFRIAENEAAGAMVGMVTANDADSGAHGRVLYSLLFDPSSDHTLFQVDDRTGFITTLQSLDRELQAVHQLTVVASDLGMPPLTSTAVVSVTVIDVNDNSPEFVDGFSVARGGSGGGGDGGRVMNNSVYVSNMAPKGYVMTRLRVVDRDAGQNALITYEMFADQMTMNLFSVNSELGTLLVRGSLVDLDGSIFELRLTARDGGNPARASSIFLLVHVNSSASINHGGDNGQLYARGADSIGGLHQNMTIVVSVVTVSGLITIALIVAIVILRRQDSDASRGATNGFGGGGVGGTNSKTNGGSSSALYQKYNCRMEALKIVSKADIDTDEMGYRGQNDGTGVANDVDDSFQKRKEVIYTNDVSRSMPNGIRCLSSDDEDRRKLSPQTLKKQSPAVYGVLSTFGCSKPVSLTSAITAPSYAEYQPVSRGSSTGSIGTAARPNVYQPDPLSTPCIQRLQQRTSSGPKTALHAEYEVNNLLQQLRKGAELDGGSVHSAEGSNTDSGQGASETEALSNELHTVAHPATHTKHGTGVGSTLHASPLTTVPEDNYIQQPSGINNFGYIYQGYNTPPCYTVDHPTSSHPSVHNNMATAGRSHEDRPLPPHRGVNQPAMVNSLDRRLKSMPASCVGGQQVNYSDANNQMAAGGSQQQGRVFHCGRQFSPSLNTTTNNQRVSQLSQSNVRRNAPRNISTVKQSVGTGSQQRDANICDASLNQLLLNELRLSTV